MKSSSDKTKTNYNNTGTDNSPGGGRKTVRLIIEGIVQGVGFRPFLHRLANKYKISGRVRNTPEGLSAALEGEAENLTDFMNALRSSPPPLSFISDIHFVFTQSLAGYSDFMIADSSLEKRCSYGD